MIKVEVLLLIRVDFCIGFLVLVKRSCKVHEEDSVIKSKDSHYHYSLVLFIGLNLVERDLNVVRRV